MSDVLSAASISHTPKILLTGGTGFVGRPLLDALVNAKYPVISVTRKRGEIGRAHV